MEPVVQDIVLDDVSQMPGVSGLTEETDVDPSSFDGAAEAAFNNAAVPGATRPRGGRATKSKGQPGCRVYVGNLSWDAAWQDLKDHMRGPAADLDVTHVDIMTEASGRSKGCAVVEYSNPNDAQRAIAELNDTDLLSRLIFVREDREINTGNVHHMPRGNAFAGGFPRGGYAAVRGGFPGAFAGGFAGGFDPYGFQQPFAHRGGFRGGYGGMPQGFYGGAGLPRGGGRGGYGMVGGRGRGAMRGRGRGGRGGGGVPGQVPGDGAGGKRVYVGNLSWECQWQELKDHMRSVGEVVRVDVLSGPDGRSKGCGLVEFSTVEEAQRAIAELNDTELMSRMIFVREDRDANAALAQ